MDTPIVPQKQCRDCKSWLPATGEFFHYSNKPKGWLRPRCKRCHILHLGRTPRVCNPSLEGGIKLCTKCGVEKELSAFYAKKNGRPDTYCRECVKARVKKGYIPSARTYLTPDQRKASKQQSDKRYAERSKDKLKAYNKSYYAKHQDEAKARTKQWAIDNPERARINSKVRKAKRRATEYAAEGHHTRQDEIRQYRSQKGRCWWCSKQLGDNWHADHLIPLNRGGTNWANNIVASCPTCNMSRRDKLPGEWNGRLL